MRLLHSVRNDIFIIFIANNEGQSHQCVITSTTHQSHQCVIASAAQQSYQYVIASEAWQSHKKNSKKSNTGLGLTSFIERRRNDPGFDFIVPYSHLEFCSRLNILYGQIRQSNGFFQIRREGA